MADEFRLKRQTRLFRVSILLGLTPLCCKTRCAKPATSGTCSAPARLLFVLKGFFPSKIPDLSDDWFFYRSRPDGI